MADVAHAVEWCASGDTMPDDDAMTIAIRFDIVPSRGSGALYLPGGKAWEARITVDGEDVASTDVSPSAALVAALVQTYLRRPIPFALQAIVAQVEEAEERASAQAITAFSAAIEHMASVKVKP